MKDVRKKIYTIIFEANTPAGKLFDVVLLLLILASVLLVLLESVKGIGQPYYMFFYIAEWIITGLFTIEYILRIYSLKKPKSYIFSFYGLIDLVSILPSYIALVFTGMHYLLVVRIFRLLRIFRIFKLNHFLSESNILVNAMRASRDKIFIFLYFVVLSVVVFGSALYVIESTVEGYGFTIIPMGIYWVIVSLTTVGYGDISPFTPLGQFLASCIMIMGYGIIAVPTGIVSVEINKEVNRVRDSSPTHHCYNCLEEGHALDAKYCRECGYKLDTPVEDIDS